jgi:transcriptional regulator with XRE-family HTH domain
MFIGHDPPARPPPTPSRLATRVAEQVRGFRTDAGLTQAELASRAGVTVETVARLERVTRGRRSANPNPSLETLARLGAALGVEVAELVAAPNPARQDSRLALVMRSATPATRRRLLCVAEALMREEAPASSPRRRGTTT